MTKDQMVWLLRSANCDENTVTVMSNAYEIGFDQGGLAAEQLTKLVEIARPLIHPDEYEFWDLYETLGDIV